MSFHLMRQKNSRYWYARITRPDSTRTSWKSTRKTSKRDAESVARQWDSAESSGHTVVTLEQAFQLLAQHMKRKKDSEDTMEILALKASHVATALGKERDISTIKLADTEAYLDHRREQGRSDTTIAKELGYLLGALKRCHRLDLYTGNWEALWPEALPKQFPGKTRWITWHEYLLLLDTISDQWRDHLVVYVSTGVRFAELYLLRTSSVRNGTLRVDGTKTEGAAREIPLSVEADEALKRRITMTSSGVLFPVSSTGDGDLMDNQKRAWLRALSGACRRAKIPHVSTNDLRRTFCSWCWHRGIDKDAVRRWMGHSSSKMIDAVYAQPSSDHYRTEIAKFPTRHLPPVRTLTSPTMDHFTN